MLVPLQFLKLHNNNERHFFLFKIFRVTKLFNEFDVSLIVRKYREKITRKNEENIEKDPSLADNIDIDQIRLEEIFLYFSFLKTLKLLVTIIMMSYLGGLVWYTFSNFLETQ